jgi:2-haloacid dehalogenase
VALVASTIRLEIAACPSGTAAYSRRQSEEPIPISQQNRGLLLMLGGLSRQKVMKVTLAFDVYGTLVNPAGMADHLAQDVGVNAGAFSALWREKQLEYSFRRGLMQNYVGFSVCTADAFEFTCRQFRVAISTERRSELMRLYQHLPAFEDAPQALKSLQHSFRLFAFSNGRAEDVAAVLSNARLRNYLDGIVSVDDVKSFKPNPAVYAYARRATGAWSSSLWLVSSNPFDVIGARSAGLDAAWVRRSDEMVYDPWGIEPSVTVRTLSELAKVLPSEPPNRVGEATAG